jgi:hypothetical protein
MAAQDVEQLRDVGSRALKGKVVGVPGLEYGGVLASEAFGEGHEADAIKDHAPYASLHDAFATEEDCGIGTGGSPKD